MPVYLFNRFLLTFISLTLMLFASHAYAQRTIVVLGDSISAAYGMSAQQGWVALLKERLKDDGINVINASISGETSSGGSARISQVLAEFKPDILILELGANDGLRGLKIQTLRDNLTNIIEQTLNASARILLLGMDMPPNYGQTYTQEFEQTYYELAKKYQLTLSPSFLGTVGLDWDLLQDDGIHPNSSAQIILLDQIWPQLQQMLTE